MFCNTVENCKKALDDNLSFCKANNKNKEETFCDEEINRLKVEACNEDPKKIPCHFTTTTPKPTVASGTTMLYAGIGGGVALLLLVVVIIVCVWRRKKAKAPVYGPSVVMSSAGTGITTGKTSTTGYTKTRNTTGYTV